MEKKKTCYVTTPIYYASGLVHIGNSYSTIVCDAFARFNRMSNKDVYFLTGMDEHGLKIQEAASKKNINTQEFVDEIAKETQQIWQNLKITNDGFVRTSDDYHMSFAQKAFEKMLANDDIYLGTYEGDYCVSCEAYFTKTQLGEGNTCPDCGKETRKVKEESYFLKLGKYSDKLLQYIKDNPDFIQPESRKNEVVSFIESGLEDLCVSRTSFSWGVPILSNPKHVIYVWVDALFNYISKLGCYTSDDSLFQKYWMNGDEVVHVIGKDILRFHAIYWPIMLMALGIPIKYKLYVHGWILMKDGKMSKSVGNIVYPNDVTSRYGLDSLRYYLVREMPLGNDAIFTYDRFLTEYNSDLANDLGNLLSRSIAMVNKYFMGKVNKQKEDFFDVDKEVESIFENVKERYLNSFANFRFQNGLIAIWDLIHRANKYIDETLPWNLAKDSTLANKLENVLYHLLEVLRNVAIMVYPVMPDASKNILKQLGLSEEELNINNLLFNLKNDYIVSNETFTLFKRVDILKELEYQEQKRNEQKKLELKPTVTIEDFSKLDIRIGEVLEAVKMDKSDKLLILKVKIENEVRQIVSGIANFYSPNEMIGKKVLVVANLKPAKLRGVISEGMILCAVSIENGKESLEVLESFKQNIFAKVQ